MKKYRLLLLLLPLLASSCGINNTMYNARKYFKAGQERALNANGRPSSQAVQDYTKAIQKCGIILSNKKITRKTDDALFLMARALYYKGNSAFQAKDQFEALIRGFPDSPFYGEAHIYLAKVYRDINQKEEAQNLLEQFLLKGDQAKLHPRALLTLAEFDIADKDYTQAQFWLEKIITGYPKAREYRDAYLLFGKNYYVQEDYESALREFDKITQSRLIPKPLRLEALYYAALNQYHLGSYDRSWRNVQKLLNDEVRPERISEIRVLQSRLLIARGEFEDGIAEIGDISTSYPRTQSSAEAQYYLGEYYFRQAHDLDQASTAYTRVRSEFPGSELAEQAQKKTTAITQLKANTGLDPETKLQEFVDYHVSAAENYLSVFALPDSALTMYQRVIDSRDTLQVRYDTLGGQLAAWQFAADSLSARIDSLPEPEISEPVEQPEILETEVEPPADSSAVVDSLDLAETEQSEPAILDSLAIPEIKVEEPAPEYPDSLDIPVIEAAETEPALPDSLASELVAAPPDPAQIRQALEQSLASLQADISAAETRRTNLAELFKRYDKELIPLALFSQASILSKSGLTGDSLASINLRMQGDYPGNKYANALTALLNGAPIRLIDPAEEAQELSLDNAFGLYETDPDSMLVVLNELSASEFGDIRLKANFRLGWFYTFQQPDTTRAKPYLEEVLKIQRSGDYADLTARFFNGSKFNFNTFSNLVDSLAVQAAADSLRLLEEQKTAADSLAAIADSLTAADSLATPETTEQPTETDRTPQLDGEGQPGATELEAPKEKEEAPAPQDPGTPLEGLVPAPPQ